MAKDKSKDEDSRDMDFPIWKKLKEAETRLNASEADLNEAALTIRLLEVERAKDKTIFEKANDFVNGYFAFNHEVSEQSVQGFLMALRNFSRQKPKHPITIELNSGGGSIVAGFQFYDELLRLRQEGHIITIRVRGMAASMAGVILQAADKREIGSNAFIMLHRAAFGAIGKAYEIEDELEFVKKLEQRIVDIFATRSGKRPKVYEDFFARRKDLWFNSDEAVKQGLVDAVA